jgi:2-hydroxycyclohexanecarboxyl-CoA dehydrogenase
MMKVDLSGRVALVTGAGSGIGRAIALKLAENGANVVVNDIIREGAEKTVELMNTLPGEGFVAIADITDYDQVRSMVDEAVKHFGRIDILINNAGWDKLEPFIKNTPETWERIIAINFKGPIHVTRAVVERMIPRKSGVIVNIASDAGRVGSLGEAVYSGCKGGLIAITKTWAREFARDNIRVNVICPGLTDTPLLESLKQTEFGAKVIDAITRQIPFGLGKPEDIANVVLFFASDASNYMTGQVVSVSGGLTYHG